MALDIEHLKLQINNQIDAWYKGELARAKPENEEAAVAELPVRDLPKDKRVVRTKSSGDRVYLLDDVKKTRSWVTNPDILKSLGFELTDVGEVDDAEFLKYQMNPAIYRVEEP